MVKIQINFISLWVLGIVSAYNLLHLHVEHYYSVNKTTHSSTIYLVFYTSAELIKYIIYDLKILFYCTSNTDTLTIIHSIMGVRGYLWFKKCITSLSFHELL